MNLPYGYLKTRDGRRLSEEAMRRIREGWDAAFRGPKFRVPVLEDVEFVPFPTEALPVPDAICLHCGRANIGTSYQCLGCNAPLVRSGKP